MNDKAMKTTVRRRFRRFTRKDLFELFVCIALAGLFVLLSSGTAFGQGNVGINNPTPHAKSLLDLTSSDKGLLTPRMTAAQRTAMFPAPDATGKGMLVYQTDGVQGFYYYDGTAWVMVQTGNAGWGLLGNSGTSVASNFLGTTDNTSVAFRTNNLERMRLSYTGNVAIGAAIDPVNYRLYVENNAPNHGVLLMNTNTSAWAGINCQSNQGAVSQLGVGNSGSGIWANLGYVGTRTNHDFTLITNEIDRLHITAAGNVGIGTTAPVRLLEVSSANQAVQRLSSANAVNGSVLELTNATAGNNMLGAINFLEGNITTGQLGYHKTDGMTMRIAGFERMRIDVNGNVGVGTQTPGSKVHVFNASSGLTPNANAISTLESSGHMYQHFLTNTGESGLLFGSAGNANTGAFLHNTTFMRGGFEMRLNGNVRRMAMSTNGHTTFGDNIHWPTMRLGAVNDGTSGAVGSLNQNTAGWSGYLASRSDFGGSLLAGFGNAGHSTLANMGFTGTGTNHPYAFITNNTERMRIDASGNVGIGTGAPIANLHVQSATQATLRASSLSAPNGSVLTLHNASAGSNTLGAVNFDDGGGTPGQVAYHSTNGLTFRTNYVERMRIAADGKVGIGTSAPAAELEVNGFTKHGTNAPAIKQVEFTGTSAATEGNFVDIVHGLTASKIIDVRVLIEYSPGNWITTGYTINPEFLADYVIGATNIRLYNHNGSSGSILSKPVKVLVTYKA